MTTWQNQTKLTTASMIVTKLASNQKLFFYFVTIFALLAGMLLGASPASADEAEEKQTAALQKVRGLLAARDLPGAKEARAEAAAIEGPVEFQNERARVETLYDAIEMFWRSVDDGGKTLQGGEELMIGEQLVAVVEYADATLVLRVAGTNRTYTLKNMPPRIALELAYRVLKRESATNQVLFACFLLIDPKGDRKMAKGLFESADKGGVETAKYLMPELDTLPPAPPIEIPAVTPLMKTLLSDKSWMLRIPGDKGAVRKPLGDVGKNNDEGRLVVAFPGGQAVQVVSKRQFAGDFVFRTILQGVQEGMSVGLFASDSRDLASTVVLPAGTVLVELERKAGKLTCKLNGAAVELTDSGEIPARFTGSVGIGSAEAAEVTMAAIELLGR